MECLLPISYLGPVEYYAVILQSEENFIETKEHSKNELINEVSKYMSDGWIPYGGVSAAAFGMSPVGGNQYIQALVRFR